MHEKNKLDISMLQMSLFIMRSFFAGWIGKRDRLQTKRILRNFHIVFSLLLISFILHK